MSATQSKYGVPAVAMSGLNPGRSECYQEVRLFMVSKFDTPLEIQGFNHNASSEFLVRATNLLRLAESAGVASDFVLMQKVLQTLWDNVKKAHATLGVADIKRRNDKFWPADQDAKLLPIPVPSQEPTALVLAKPKETKKESGATKKRSSETNEVERILCSDDDYLTETTTIVRRMSAKLALASAPSRADDSVRRARRDATPSPQLRDVPERPKAPVAKKAPVSRPIVEEIESESEYEEVVVRRKVQRKPEPVKPRAEPVKPRAKPVLVSESEGSQAEESEAEETESDVEEIEPVKPTKTRAKPVKPPAKPVKPRRKKPQSDDEDDAESIASSLRSKLNIKPVRSNEVVMDDDAMSIQDESPHSDEAEADESMDWQKEYGFKKK